jgi:hypothetical protein
VKESNRSISKGSIAQSRPEVSIVFCGDAQQVGVGFTLALEAMAVCAGLLTMEMEPTPKTERENVRCESRAEGAI